MGKLLDRCRSFYKKRIYELLRPWRSGKSRSGEAGGGQPETKQVIRPQNPHISYIRFLVEQVLAQRNLTYQTLRLAVEDIGMDGQEAAYAALASDDMMDTLYQLAYGLNHLLIITDRPEYFADYVEMMYEEYGLVVELRAKSRPLMDGVNLVLDFSYEGRSASGQDAKGYLYIPIYRKPWKMAGNLDIMVPIGYNIVIVKRSVDKDTVEPLDKFEREFYA